MSKKRPRKKYQVVRTVPPMAKRMDKKTRKEVAGFGLTVPVALITGGSVMVANHNPFGYLILLAGLTICWSIITWMKWIPALSRPVFRWGGQCLIVLVCVIPLCLSFGNVKSPIDKTDTPIAKVGPTSGVASYGQTGGTTAQTVIQNQTINNYFANQMRDEKEKWRSYLTTKYPLGWSIFAADGKEIYVPNGLSYEKDFVVAWGSARVHELSAEKVRLVLPDITWGKPLKRFSQNTVGLHRKVGSTDKFILAQTTMVIELLKDEGAFVILAIGFRDADYSADKT